MAEMVKRSDRVAEFRSILENPNMLRQLSLAAPQHLRADRIVRLAMTTLQNQPDLLNCTWQSVVGCVMTCTQLGLEIEATQGQAYMVPFKDNRSGTSIATLIPGYRGLMNLALRTGQIVSIEARVVRQCDEFEFLDEPPMLRHKRDLDVDPDDFAMTHVYAVAVHNDSGNYRQYEVLSRAQVLAIKKRSRASKKGPWVTDEPEMWRKSAVRRLCKYLPQSPELSSAVTLDEQADSGIPQTLAAIDEIVDGGSDHETSGPHATASPAASSIESETAPD